MITTLLFDFSWVLAFPYTKKLGASSAYHQAQDEQKPWQQYLSFNQEIIDFVAKNQTQYSSYIFSASSPQLITEVTNQLIPPFKGVFSSKKLQLSKHQPSSYLQLAKLIGVEPNEILFTDDKTANVRAAKLAGLIAIEFKSNQDFFKQIEKIVQPKV